MFNGIRGVFYHVLMAYIVFYIMFNGIRGVFYHVLMECIVFLSC